MPMPDQATAERMRAAISEMSGREKGLGETFDQALNEMLGGISPNDDLVAVAKDFLECLRKLDRAFDAGDAAGCVLLGARKEAKDALEDAGFSSRQAKSLIALGVSLCGPEAEPVRVLTPEEWRNELPDRDDDEDEAEERPCANCGCEEGVHAGGGHCRGCEGHDDDPCQKFVPEDEEE